AFLFTEDDVFKRIENLSGGERGRVSLAKLMLSDANFLILDEPTNHLDMDSKMVLEDAVNHFEGTVLYVSHDRYFINQTATRILDLTNHRLLDYIGNFDYYLEKKEDMERAHLGGENFSGQDTGKSSVQSQAEKGAIGKETIEKGAVFAGEVGKSNGKASWEEQKKEQARLRKLSNTLERTEKEIERLEAENEQIDKELLKPEVATNSVKLQELSKKREENELCLSELMEEWEELSEQL
ncbi:MAG: ABC-F family ATP-binding cassette domain-containing protein, partial [Lachnospiraceae bacterium]|nr:ABC-F family ATP-binding cassette domain-containing protein [Lachnospiraceae bacterium]